MSFDLREEIASGLEGIIHWRGEKAAEHPDDRRNTDAVDIARLLLAGDKTISAETQARFARLVAALERHPDVDDLMADLSTATSEIFRSIGFRSEPKGFDDIATDICAAIDAILANAEP